LHTLRARSHKFRVDFQLKGDVVKKLRLKNRGMVWMVPLSFFSNTEFLSNWYRKFKAAMFVSFY